MIAAVTFDFWETLVHETHENLERGRAMRLRGIGALLSRVGTPQASAALDAAYERSGEIMRERYWAEHRDASAEAQVRVFLDCLQTGLGDRIGADALAEAIDVYASPVLHLPPLLSTGASDVVRELARRGVRLGVVSNTGRTPGVMLRRVLERYELLGYFSVLSYSDEVGVRKPDREIFARTLSALGVSPADALHVGDNPVADVEGARNFGMRTAHYVANGAPPAPAADYVLAGLAELPALL